MTIYFVLLCVILSCYVSILLELKNIKEKTKQDKEGYKNMLNLIHNEQVYQAELMKKIINKQTNDYNSLNSVLTKHKEKLNDICSKIGDKK